MDFIYTKNILTKEICNDIICFFNNQSENKYVIDYNLPEWKNIYNHLYYQLNININNYLLSLTKHMEHANYNFFKINQFVIDDICIKKYCKEHINNLTNNINIDLKYRTYSIMNFIFILDDTSNEIEFINTKIKTEKGQLIIFPSFWSFPFKDTNINDTKYIISGLIHCVNKELFVNL